MKNYWAVGAAFGADDMSGEFIKKSIWYDGYADDGDKRDDDILKQINVGDCIVMKSSSTKGPGHSISFTKVKGVGIITEKEDYYSFKVSWLTLGNLPRDFDGIWYSRTVEGMRDDEILEFATNAVSDYEHRNVLQGMCNILDHKKQVILQGPPGTGKTYTAKDVAEIMILKTLTGDKSQQKRMLDSSGQFKLTQFHPAYSYEDFVRGITANATELGIEYKTEDKVLAEFAAIALENWEDHNKNAATVSYENWVMNELELFADTVEDQIEAKGSYPLNESVSVYGIDFKEGNNAFRYTGKNKVTGDSWDVGNKQRMKFKDIALAHIANAQNRQDIKKVPGISGRAKEHATYDFLMLTKFREFLQARPPFVAGSTQAPLNNYVLIIDEINRANLPAVLGELIYALEYRGESVTSMYEYEGDREITLPPNLYIIGTMNTADRSVGHIDYAIRRRFAFVDVPPSDTVIDEVVPATNDLKGKAKRLFNKVAEFFTPEKLAADFKKNEVQLGHSYFLAETENELKLKLDYEIKPLLREYLKDGILKSVRNADGKDQTETDIESLTII